MSGKRQSAYGAAARKGSDIFGTATIKSPAATRNKLATCNRGGSAKSGQLGEDRSTNSVESKLHGANAAKSSPFHATPKQFQRAAPVIQTRMASVGEHFLTSISSTDEGEVRVDTLATVAGKGIFGRAMETSPTRRSKDSRVFTKRDLLEFRNNNNAALLRKILRRRIAHVRCLRSMWDDGDLLGAVHYVNAVGDPGLGAAMLQSITHRTLEPVSGQTSAVHLCTVLSPILKSSLCSRYEDYNIAALKALASLLKSLGPDLNAACNAQPKISLEQSQLVAFSNCLGSLGEIRPFVGALFDEKDEGKQMSPAVVADGTVAHRARRIAQTLDSLMSPPIPSRRRR